MSTIILFGKSTSLLDIRESRGNTVSQLEGDFLTGQVTYSEIALQIQIQLQPTIFQFVRY